MFSIMVMCWYRKRLVAMWSLLSTMGGWSLRRCLVRKWHCKYALVIDKVDLDNLGIVFTHSWLYMDGISLEYMNSHIYILI